MQGWVGRRAGAVAPPRSLPDWRLASALTSAEQGLNLIEAITAGLNCSQLSAGAGTTAGIQHQSTPIKHRQDGQHAA